MPDIRKGPRAQYKAVDVFPVPVNKKKRMRRRNCAVQRGPCTVMVSKEITEPCQVLEEVSAVQGIVRRTFYAQVY